eukprot:3363210-Pyramimonas_sp.AAC.1
MPRTRKIAIRAAILPKAARRSQMVLAAAPLPRFHPSWVGLPALVFHHVSLHVLLRSDIEGLVVHQSGLS